jgi:hypothetical protein
MKAQRCTEQHTQHSICIALLLLLLMLLARMPDTDVVVNSFTATSPQLTSSRCTKEPRSKEHTSPSNMFAVCATLALVLASVSAQDSTSCSSYDVNTGSGVCSGVKVEVGAVICVGGFDKSKCKASQTIPDGRRETYYFKVSLPPGAYFRFIAQLRRLVGVCPPERHHHVVLIRSHVLMHTCTLGSNVNACAA